MDRIRVGFAGAGFAASFHEQSLRQITVPGVTPAAVWSRTRERAEVFARDRGLRACGSLEELLESVDVVHVCVPPSLHESVSVAALQR